MGSFTWSLTPLGQVRPDQQALDTETKLLTHAIRISVFNTMTALADVHTRTGYARAKKEAHALIRQALTGTGDIIPGTDTGRRTSGTEIHAKGSDGC